MSDDTIAGPANQVTTVDIINPHNPNKILRINKADFDDTKHVILAAGDRERTQQEIDLLKKIQANYKKLQAAQPATPKDDRDAEIERLRAQLAAMQSAPAPVEPVKAAEPASKDSKDSGKKSGSKAAEPASGGDSLAGLKDL